MADLIQVKRGETTGVAFLADGELGYSRGEKALYIGDGGRRNQKICSATEMSALISSVETLRSEVSGKLTASAAVAQAPLADTTELAVVVEAFNSLISALQASGLMNTEEVS